MHGGESVYRPHVVEGPTAGGAEFLVFSTRGEVYTATNQPRVLGWCTAKLVDQLDYVTMSEYYNRPGARGEREVRPIPKIPNILRFEHFLPHALQHIEHLSCVAVEPPDLRMVHNRPEKHRIRPALFCAERVQEVAFILEDILQRELNVVVMIKKMVRTLHDIGGVPQGGREELVLRGDPRNASEFVVQFRTQKLSGRGRLVGPFFEVDYPGGSVLKKWRCEGRSPGPERSPGRPEM